MVQEVHKVAREIGGLRIVIADSATSVTASNRNDIVVNGSHCAANMATDYLFPMGVRGAIGNDAGIGLDNAGIGALAVLEEMSAEIGVGQSTYDDGIISAINKAAGKMGVAVGMSARDAADRMLDGALESGTQGADR
jgi:hypothetical protein